MYKRQAAILVANPRAMPPNQIRGYVHESEEGAAPAGGGGHEARDGVVDLPNSLSPPVRSDRDVAIAFLRDAGFEEHELRGTWNELAAYVCGLLNGTERSAARMGAGELSRLRDRTSSPGVSSSYQGRQASPGRSVPRSRSVSRTPSRSARHGTPSRLS